jgi:NAD(P)-dependent dehydrogenase (short-subunit alcohol dehydrogenase family)
MTGSSLGFGGEWTRAALSHGDKVAVTARDVSTLDDDAVARGGGHPD